VSWTETVWESGVRSLMDVRRGALVPDDGAAHVVPYGGEDLLICPRFL